MNVSHRQKLAEVLSDISWKKGCYPRQVKQSLMAAIPPHEANSLKKEFETMIKEFEDLYIEYAYGSREKITDPSEIETLREFAADSIALDRWHTIMESPNLYEEEKDDVDVINSFLYAFPSEDDYWQVA